MQPLNLGLFCAHRRAAGIGLALFATLAGNAAAHAECPWIVQPHGSASGSAGASAYDIVFDGMNGADSVFYGFTVADIDLAWRLNEKGALPELQPDARPLQVVQTAEGPSVFQLSDDSITPHTIYLVAAASTIDKLEAVDARIEPSRPVAVSFNVRGASDISGALPHRSMPGVEIKSADAAASGGMVGQGVVQVAENIQICAYQVAMR